MNRIEVAILVAITLLSTSLMAQTLKEGRVNGEASLYQKPYSDAKVVTVLQADSKVSVIQRKGGWYQIKSGNKVSGWLRMNNLRFGESGADKQAGNVQGLQQTIKLFKTGRSGTSGVTVATGIRGLDATDLQNSKPDHQALTKLADYTSDQNGVRSFALAVKLKSQQLGYIVEEAPK